MKIGLRGLALPLLIILVWWLAAGLGIGVGILPGPWEVIITCRGLLASGELQAHVRISLLRIVQGFLLAAGLAVPTGILAARFSPFAQYVSPLLGFLRQVPPVAWIPVLIMVLGIGEATKLAVIVYAAFFPIFMNTILGITQIDSSFWEVARLLELSPREVLRELVLPAAAPSLIAGLRLGMSNSWRALVAAEMLAAFSGLGYMITAARSLVRMDEMFIGIAAIGLFGLVIDWGWKLLERRVLRWQNRD
ncbi:MAG: ABC transporter permease [Firmicutes bacterium]|jgi:sulfonate transport system permease protein|nr:ABC transporter permease [Bacillota bacterium]